MNPSQGEWIDYSDISNSYGRSIIFVYVPRRKFWRFFEAVENRSHLMQVTLKFQFQKDWSESFKSCEVRDFWTSSASLTADQKKQAINEFIALFPEYANFVCQTTLVL